MPETPEPTRPLFPTLTEEEMEKVELLTKDEILELLEQGRLARDAAERLGYGCFRPSGVYFR